MPCPAQLVMTFVILFGYPSLRMEQSKTPADALLDMLVWGGPEKVDRNQYPGEVRESLDAYLRRLRQFKTRLPHDATSGVMVMVQASHIGYEKRLVALSDDPRAPELAADYVKALRPCYETEGFHDCPQREAEFAEKYLQLHPASPFGTYLVLLAAHRWLCTAEAYEYEKSQEDSALARKQSKKLLSKAQVSADPLVRAAANALAARGKCFAPER
jgi:hypothetical protein